MSDEMRVDREGLADAIHARWESDNRAQSMRGYALAAADAAVALLPAPQPDTADRALAAELAKAHERIASLEWLLQAAGRPLPAPHPQGGTDALAALLWARSTCIYSGDDAEAYVQDWDRVPGDETREAYRALARDAAALLAAAPAPTEVGDE